MAVVIKDDVKRYQLDWLQAKFVHPTPPPPTAHLVGGLNDTKRDSATKNWRFVSLKNFEQLGVKAAITEKICNSLK